jgi:hypothetical protein
VREEKLTDGLDVLKARLVGPMTNLGQILRAGPSDVSYRKDHTSVLLITRQLVLSHVANTAFAQVDEVAMPSWKAGAPTTRHATCCHPPGPNASCDVPWELRTPIGGWSLQTGL